MLFLTHLVKFSISSLDGIEFSPDRKTLISAPTNLVNYVIPATCEIIEGGDSPLKSSFVQCINTIKNITVEDKSNLKCIYPYVFKHSSLEYVDLSSCTKLAFLNRSIFYECFKLSFVLLPEGITEIKAGCFYRDISLRSITIPDSVISLETWTSGHSSVFTDCSSLAEVKISENSNLVLIDADALAGTIITHLYIPRNLTTLSRGIFNTRILSFTIHPENQYYFFDDTALLSKNKEIIYFLKYNEGMTYTPPEYIKVFGSCCCRGNHLKKIFFDHKVTFNYFCFGESNLQSFTFPEGITIIPERMFQGCNNLTTVHLPASLTKISCEAFKWCTSLSEINMIDGVTSIDNIAFELCTSLKTFKCPKNLTSLEWGVFCGCSDMNFDINGNTALKFEENGVLYLDNIAKAFFGSKTEIVLSSTCNIIDRRTFQNTRITKITFTTESPLSIYEEAFLGTFLEEISLGSNLNTLLSHAFCNITTLKTVRIDPASTITGIPSFCFCNCSSLSTITFPTKIKSVDEEAFSNCIALTQFNIENTEIVKIGRRAFANTSLTSVKSPSTLILIGEEAYKHNKLQTVDLSASNLATVEEGTFSSCPEMNSVIFSDKTKTIKSYSFSGCKKLTEFELPQEIETIKLRAFEYCSSLQKFNLKLNCNLDVIEGLAFIGCPELKEIGVKPEDTKFVAVNGVLYNYDKTTLIIFLPASVVTIFVVPATVQKIGSYAFHSCRFVHTIVIPEGNIKSVGFHSFEGCESLSSLILPSTLEQFGKDAFINCKSLRCGSVYYQNGDKKKALAAGIPEIAFETNCPKITFQTCKNRYTFIPNVYLFISLMLYSF